MSVLATILTLLVILLLAALLIGFGFELANGLLQHQRADVHRHRQLLDAEWRALENTRRVRGVFLDARRTMQREADVRQRFRRGEQ